MSSIFFLHSTGQQNPVINQLRTSRKRKRDGTESCGGSTESMPINQSLPMQFLLLEPSERGRRRVSKTFFVFRLCQMKGETTKKQNKTKYQLLFSLDWLLTVANKIYRLFHELLTNSQQRKIVMEFLFCLKNKFERLVVVVEND